MRLFFFYFSHKPLLYRHENKKSAEKFICFHLSNVCEGTFQPNFMCHIFANNQLPFLQWWEVIVSYYMVVGFVYTVKPNMSKPYLLKTNEIDRYSVYIICKFYFGMDTRRIVILHHLEQKIVCMVHISSTDNRIGGVMVSMLAWSVVDCGFEPLSGQTQWLILVFVTYPLRTTCFKE